MRPKLRHHLVSALWLLCALVRAVEAAGFLGLPSLTTPIPDTDTLKGGRPGSNTPAASESLCAKADAVIGTDRPVSFLPLGLSTPKKGNEITHN